jgi:hypothetical protein
VEGSPRLEGRNAHITISPVKAKERPKAGGQQPAAGSQ